MAGLSVNLDVKVKDKKLVLTIDLAKKGTPSASGKSVLIASSRGNMAVPGQELTYFSLNVFQFPEKK